MSKLTPVPPSDDRDDPGPLSYEELRERGRAATLRGDFRAAAADYQKAKEIAQAGLDQTRIDEADLNLSMVHLQMGEARKGEEGLREILLRTTEPRLGLAAAYDLASSLRRQGRHERALVYAKRALEKARSLRSPSLLAMVHNLLGNILLSQSYLDEALGEYRKALRLRESQSGDTRYSRALVLENMGYCLILKHRVEEGLRGILRALDLAEQVGDRRCRAECLQDLCYGLLLQGRHEEAIGRGEQALAEAEAGGYADIVENCHYLLGELGTRTGDLELRDRHFQKLQALHPELPFLRDFLCAVDVTSIITLRR